MICACTVTSSAVVGSSRISSRGRRATAIAIITRWRMPPESWCGYEWSTRCGSPIPSSRRRSATREASAASRANRVCPAAASATCSPAVSSGLRYVIGSWKTYPTAFPQSARNALASSVARSTPSNTMLPSPLRPGGGSNPKSERTVTRLAAARFADEADDFAGVDVEVDAFDGANGSAARARKLDAELAHAKERAMIPPTALRAARPGWRAPWGGPAALIARPLPAAGRGRRSSRRRAD